MPATIGIALVNILELQPVAKWVWGQLCILTFDPVPLRCSLVKSMIITGGANIPEHVIMPASKERFSSVPGTVSEVSVAAMIEAATRIGQIFMGKREQEQHEQQQHHTQYIRQQ